MLVLHVAQHARGWLNVSAQGLGHKTTHLVYTQTHGLIKTAEKSKTRVSILYFRDAAKKPQASDRSDATPLATFSAFDHGGNIAPTSNPTRIAAGARRISSKHHHFA